MTWTTTPETMVKVGDTWIKRSALQAVTPTVDGAARCHLSGGTTVDVQKPSTHTLTEWVDAVASRIYSAHPEELK